MMECHVNMYIAVLISWPSHVFTCTRMNRFWRMFKFRIWSLCLCGSKGESVKAYQTNPHTSRSTNKIQYPTNATRVTRLTRKCTRNCQKTITPHWTTETLQLLLHWAIWQMINGVHHGGKAQNGQIACDMVRTTLQIKWSNCKTEGSWELDLNNALWRTIVTYIIGTFKQEAS